MRPSIPTNGIEQARYLAKGLAFNCSLEEASPRIIRAMGPIPGAAAVVQAAEGRVQVCDPDQLEVWAERAVHAADAQDLFVDAEADPA